MKTTIDIADEVFRAAKVKAADEGVPLRNVVENALRSYLGQSQPRKSGYKLQWRTEKGRLQPGVTLEDRQALLDLMDEGK